VFLEVYPQVLGVSTLKRCYSCGQWQTHDAYYTDKSRKDGLQPKCKACHAEYRRKNAARAKEYSRVRVDEHRERYRERRKLHAIEHAESIKKYKQQYHAKHAEELRAKASAYRLTEQGRKVERSASERRRARELNAPGTFTTADIDAIRVAQGNRCYICHKKLKQFHIDHFIPLSKGGTNDPGNLRLACPKCNNFKRAKHPHDMGILI
jgi:5-methylcytosine-specific restriction endonuclease McrA